jgi:preprotein translocase subunit SecG
LYVNIIVVVVVVVVVVIIIIIIINNNELQDLLSTVSCRMEAAAGT